MQEIGEFSKKVKEKNKVRLKAKHHDPPTVGGSRNTKKSAVGFLIQRRGEVFAWEHGFDALEIFFQENKLFLDLGILHVLEVQDPA